LIYSGQKSILWVYLDRMMSREWEISATIYYDNDIYTISEHIGNDLASITQELFNVLKKKEIEVHFIDLMSRVESLNRLLSIKPKYRRHSK